MPAAIRFMGVNLIDRDSTVLTATSNVLPVSNVKHPHLKKVWRTSTRTNERINVDLVDTSATVKSFAIAGINLTRDGTIELLHSTDNSAFTSLGIINVDPSTKTGYGNAGYGDAGYGGFALTNDAGPALNKALFLFFSGLTSRYWRILLNDSANPDNFLSVGRVFLGDYLEPSAQIARGWKAELIDETVMDKSIGGQKWRNTRPVFMQMTFRLPHLNENQGIRDLFNTFFRRFGKQTDLFVVLFPDGSQQLQSATAYYGSFESGLGVSNPAIGVYSTDDLVFQESL